MDKLKNSTFHHDINPDEAVAHGAAIVANSNKVDFIKYNIINLFNDLGTIYMFIIKFLARSIQTG